jgi:hypothetical protein
MTTEKNYIKFEEDINIIGTSDLSSLLSIRYLGTALVESKHIVFLHKKIKVIEATCWSIVVSIQNKATKTAMELKKQLEEEIEAFYKIAGLK